MKQFPMKLFGRSCVCAHVENSNNSTRSMLMAELTAAVLVFGALGSAQAVTINTNVAGNIAAFQAGATVENFDTGLTGLVITNYSGVNVPAGSQFNSRSLANPLVPEFNSGGATFTNPASNPGTPVGVFNPEGGIAAEVSSQTNVIGPLVVGSTQAFGSGFMEVIFTNPVNKVGFQVTHGSVTLILKDINNSNLAGVDSSVNGTIGNFIGISRSTADIGGVTILSTNQNDSFTLDDFTFGRGTTTTVPDSGSILNLVIAGAFLWFTKRKLKSNI